MTINEAFDFGPWAYNIDAARQILAEVPRELIHIEVGPLVHALFRGAARIDIAHVYTVNLAEPIIVIPVPDHEISDARRLDYVEELPIDGWHRVAKAFLTGEEILPAYALTEDEANRIRILIRGVHLPRTATDSKTVT